MEQPHQVTLSSAQLGVLRYVHDQDRPVPTGGSSNFTAGWVSGQVAEALVSKGLLHRDRVGSVSLTPAGRALLAQYLRDR